MFSGGSLGPADSSYNHRVHTIPTGRQISIQQYDAGSSDIIRTYRLMMNSDK